MAHYEYYSTVRNLVESTRTSHINMIERICADLGQPEKSEEMIGKYVDDSLRIKKFKDKRHPKRPKSGYMIYCEKRRPACKAANPKASFADIIKKMASEWNGLGEKAKSEYSNLAEKDKLRYKAELEEYNAEIYKSNVSTSN
tara:strand:- start:5547 stop:5972 length:426 start_codon:yes stop_codon:yes gene_type:complete